MSEYKASTNGAGWTCANCGQWVPAGDWHSCGLITPDGENSTLYRINPFPDKQDQIIELLERILKLLEAHHDR